MAIDIPQGPPLDRFAEYMRTVLAAEMRDVGFFTAGAHRAAVEMLVSGGWFPAESDASNAEIIEAILASLGVRPDGERDAEGYIAFRDAQGHPRQARIYAFRANDGIVLTARPLPAPPAGLDAPRGAGLAA